MKMKLFRIYILFIFSFAASLRGQTLYSSLDKNIVEVGEPNVYRIKIDGVNAKDVAAAPKNELLPFHFEVIKDSIIRSQDMYERTVEFSIFQEGDFRIPPLDFVIDGRKFSTIPYEIKVTNPAQAGDPIIDIMNNKELPLGIRDYWQMYKWYILGTLAVAALALALWQILRYGRKLRRPEVRATNSTLRQLEDLRKKNYLQAGDFRSFYVGLIEITRHFLSTQYHFPAEVLLTEDLIEYLQKNSTISEENEKAVSGVLLRGDNAKFAKIFPEAQQAVQDFENIKAFVKRSSKDLELQNLRQDV